MTLAAAAPAAHEEQLTLAASCHLAMRQQRKDHHLQNSALRLCSARQQPAAAAAAAWRLILWGLNVLVAAGVAAAVGLLLRAAADGAGVAGLAVPAALKDSLAVCTPPSTSSQTPGTSTRQHD